MKQLNKQIWILMLLIGAVLVVACSGGGETAEPATDDHDSEQVAEGEDGHDHEDDHADEGEYLSLPELDAAALDGAPLKVVATTSIIGDVVAQVGGDAIDLTVLMGPGQDPHSFEPSARLLTAVADAHVIFVNGWDLEEALVHDLEEIGTGVPLLPISANIEPLAFGEDDHEDEDEAEGEEHEHSGADPHVWLSIHNVAQWVENVAQVLSDLDPANAAAYESNATVYLAELAELEGYAETQLAQVPADRRFLVTNHSSLAYFAHEYDFTILGTVIPGSSTLAEPSASDLTALIAAMEGQGICTMFTETAVSDSLAQTVAGELNECDEVQVVPLYTGALGLAGSGADNYIGMFRANVDTIVEGLSQ